jgi:hypothetical protein
MVIYSCFPSNFLDDKEAYDKEARSYATEIERCAHRVSNDGQLDGYFSRTLRILL